MRYLIAPNAFKGTIQADEAARIISKKIRELSSAECILEPVADGGDGTCSLLIDSLGLEKIQVWTLNAIGQPIQGFFGWDSGMKMAFLDISTASGIGILESPQRDPHTASTFGTGMIIQRAVEMGANEIVLGLGGSATIDLGIGILAALGILFLDENGREIPLFSSGFLAKIKHIQRSHSIPKIRFTCLCDVKNLFLGENGAVNVFGSQKGLGLHELESFEKTCAQVLELLLKKSTQKWADKEGFGAAGGVALGLGLFFETEIKFGAAYFFELIRMQEKILQSDWIITGEGQYDNQSTQGKACFELMKLAQIHQKKICLITSGQESKGAGFDLVIELPALDFSSSNFKEKARENLNGLIEKAILEGDLD